MVGQWSVDVRSMVGQLIRIDKNDGTRGLLYQYTVHQALQIMQIHANGLMNFDRTHSVWYRTGLKPIISSIVLKPCTIIIQKNCNKVCVVVPITYLLNLFHSVYRSKQTNKMKYTDFTLAPSMPPHVIYLIAMWNPFEIFISVENAITKL